ncbi:MAG: integration host factor subunit alpha [Methylocapsa sp.]|nr:integration host factor subunit alpha [Methylocapsa sp.]
MAESGSVRIEQGAGTAARELFVHASGSRRTITRADLAEAVYRRIGLSRKESALLVEALLDELANTLAAGEAVKLSSFGRFSIRSKSERIGRNPKTGVEVPITERRVMVFKPSNMLRARINGIEAGELDGEDGDA